MRLLRFFVPGMPPAASALGTQWIIGVGFVVVLALMALLTALGLSHMKAIKVRMANLVTESNVKIESVYQMRSIARERFASLGQMVVLQDPFERDDEFMRFQAQADTFIRARDRLLKLGMSPEEAAIWVRARSLIQRDEQLHDAVIELAMRDERDAALAMLLRDVRPVENALLGVFNELVEQYQRNNQRALHDSDADYREAAAYMLTLAALALLMGIVIARLVILRSRQTEAMLSRQSEAALAAAEQLSWAASHDSLTGLANRREAQRVLNLLVQDAQTNGPRHVLLFIDLDRFKAVNDSCGHLAGDELLRQLATIFTRHVRSGDLVARLGGDEFCVGLANCDVDAAARIAESIRDETAQFRFDWEGQTYRVGASIGLVQVQPSMDVAAVLKAADAACYQAKEQGRNRVCVYDERRPAA